MIKTNNTTSWQEEAGDSILAGLRNKGREKALVIPKVAVAEPVKPMKPMKEQGEKLFGVKRGVSKVLANNADVPFVDRINNYQDYPMPEKNEDGSISTHLLSAELDEEGIAWVFPNKVLNKKNNTYTTYRDNYEALAAAKADGNAVRFNTIQEANLFSQSYKNEDFEKYYSPSEEERAKTFEGSGRNIIDTAKQAYKGVLNVIEESPIPLFGKDSLGTDTLGKVADAIPLVKSALSPEDSVEKRKEEIEKLSVDIEEITPDNLSLTQQGFRAAFESAPLTAVAMVTSIFGTPAAGLAVMGAYTGSLEFNEAREKGKAYGESLVYGTIQGGIEAFTERLSLGPLMKMFKDRGNGFTSTIKNAIAYGTRELIGENAAEFGQSMTAWYAGLDGVLTNPDLSKTEKLIIQAQRQWVASVAALSMSGTTTTATVGVNSLASQVKTNNEPSIAEGWVKSKATYTRKDKDGNEIEKETGGIKYTRTVYANGEPVLPEKITREKKIKDNVNKEAPANKEGMYSKLEEALLNMKLETNNPQDVMGYFKNNSVVWDEMRDSGMLTFLQESIKEGKPVTRTELMKEFKIGSIMKSYRRETLTPSSEKDVSFFDLLPESDIVTINEYGLEDEANRPRANGRTLNEQEIEDRVAGSSNDMYSEIVGDAINMLRVSETDWQKDKGRTRGPELLTENLSSNYSQKEIQTLVMSATQKANQELLTNPTTVSDVVTTKEEGKKALNNLITSAKEQGYITYVDMVEILPADYLATEQFEGIIKVLDELDIIVPDKKDIPKADLPLLRKNKLAQIEYIEKYLPEDLKNDLDTSTKEQARKFLEENPEYVWDVETEEFAYNVVGYDGAYTLTITAKSYGSQGARKMLTEEYSSLNEVQVQMKRHDQSNSIDPVVSDKDAAWSKQLYNSPNLDRKTYKETLIIMDGPEGGELKGGLPYTHYSGINNTVLHLRTSERKDIDGNKVLYIEEIQSDWLEAGERVFGKDMGDLYGMPEFGWRDQEKYITAISGLSEKNDEYEATAKELITIFRTNLRRQFPEKNNDGTVYNEKIRSQEPYQTDGGGTSFQDFRNKFKNNGASGEADLIRAVYFSDVNDIDALVTKFSETYDNFSNDPYSGLPLAIGNLNEHKAEALSGFARFFKTFKTVTNSKEFYDYDSREEVRFKNTLINKGTPNIWLGFLSKKEYLRLGNESDKQEDTRAEIIKAQKSVPKMPMKDKWHEFGMRVAVNMAVEGNFDRIAWTNSDEQVRRWNVGSKESARYNEAAGKVIKTPVPEGVNKKMFISLYDKKLPSYAKRLANQYNSKSGKVGINFLNVEGDYGASYDTDNNYFPRELKNKSSYLDISPEMIEAFKTGRVKFYSKGGLVSRPNTYRRKFAEGGEVEPTIKTWDNIVNSTTPAEYQFTLTNAKWKKLIAWFKTEHTPKVKDKEKYLRGLSSGELETMWEAMGFIKGDVNIVGIANDGQPIWYDEVLTPDAIPKSMNPPIGKASSYTEEEKVKAEEIAAAGEALKTELKRWMKATGELQNKKKEAKLASQEIMDEIQTELKAVSTAKENIVKDKSTRTTPDWLVTAGKQISDGLRKDSRLAKQKKKKEIKDEGRGLKGYTLPKKTDKPGWKLPEEGGNYWSIDTAHAHWQTDKGQKEAVKLFGKKPGWVKNKSFYDTNRQKFAEGGNVEAPVPFTGLKDYILHEITNEKKWIWGTGKIRDEMVRQVSEGFLRLGPDPKKEKILSFYNNAIPQFELYLGKDAAGRITDAYEIAFDDYFNYEIPGSESESALKVAGGASAIAGGGSTLLSQGKEWWNKGRNVRVPGENKASWKTLLKDSAKQLTKSDAAFKAGKTGLSTLRPLKAFTPSMLGTGPDPATRQLVGRTGNLLSKAASAVPRWLSAPLQILNPTKLGDGMLPEEGTPEYIQQMKTSDDMWKNYNNSLLESRQVRSNIANKRDKREGVRQAKAEDEARADARERARALEAEQIRAQKIADKQAKEHAKAMEDRNKNTVVDNQGNKGYTGTGNQSRAPKPPPPAANPPRGGTSKNYGVTGKRVTGGR